MKNVFLGAIALQTFIFVTLVLINVKLAKMVILEQYAVNYVTA